MDRKTVSETYGIPTDHRVTEILEVAENFEISPEHEAVPYFRTTMTSVALAQALARYCAMHHIDFQQVLRNASDLHMQLT